jgi:hypothetical protein
MIAWLIITINGFLDGELTTKSILKTLTALIISGAIFSFYLYDIKRENVVGKKDKVIATYTWSSLVLVVIVFIVAFMVVESPQETRKRHVDEEVIGHFNQIDNSLNNYYRENGEIPADLYILQAEYQHIDDDILKNPSTKEEYEYKVISEKEYELCTTFQLSNKEEQQDKYRYINKDWIHDAGYQCLSQKILETPKNEEQILIR